MSVTQLIAVEILQLIVLAIISRHADVLKLRLVPVGRNERTIHRDPTGC
jgi:hypothetical protein